MSTQPLPKNLNSIAVFRALQLGDMLCSIPTFRALRAAYPEAKITLIGLPWAKELVTRYPSYLDDFISFPGFPGFPEQEVIEKAFPAFLKDVQERNFDLVLQMQGNGSLSNPLVSLFKSKLVAGFTADTSFTPNTDYFVPYPDSGHETHRLLSLTETLGIPSQGDKLEFPLTEYELDDFELLSEENDLEPFSYVCLHPGSRAADRRWDPKYFAEVGNYLASLGIRLVLTGSPSERDLTKAVAKDLHTNYLDLSGKTSLGGMSCLLAHARLLVANDTGVSHIASALNVPSIIIFTGSEMSRWAPLDTAFHRTIDGNEENSVKNVLQESQNLLTFSYQGGYKFL